MENSKYPDNNIDREAFEKKYLEAFTEDYNKIISTYSKEKRADKEALVSSSFQTLRSKLQSEKGISFSPREESILKLKLARYAQLNDQIDNNTLYDAIIESPTFITKDKGSFTRLLEVHEQKTLQKIAEKRKQRAEMTHTEGLNPYEALFTTTSGNYYMARLLNMPHLEKESEYMKHCVGTSDSYLNRMKRGEVEILSFRTVPKMNHKTNKLEGDTPVITIEYNLKTKTIEQMKKAGDDYLNKNDPYYIDITDALKQLRATETDTGELRDFKKIAPGELSNIIVTDNYVLTDKGEIPLDSLELNNLILKFGKLSNVSKENTTKILKMVDNIDTTPDQIAEKQEEVSDKTKVYIGPLFPGVFELPLDHIYTSLPEGKIQKYKVELGGKSKDELRLELKKQKINISSYADDLLESKDFSVSSKIEEAKLVRLSVKDLNFPAGATTDQIYDKATEYGLELCPPEAGPALRLSYQGDDWMLIAMKQITDRGNSPYVFYLGRNGGDLWLNGYHAKPASRWNAAYQFVFRIRKSET